MNLETEISAVFPEIVDLRHAIHANPELSFFEENTVKIVSDFLAKQGYTKIAPLHKTGLLALLETHKPGPVIALRADMDALPVQENNSFSYVSKKERVMHACGHDGHTANLLCVAAVLSKIKHELRGTIKFIFQPAEEISEGASALIGEGVLEHPHVDYILGLHNWPDFPVGHIGVKDACILCGIDMFNIKVVGKGGHSSMRQECVDPIKIASELKLELEKLPSRLSEATELDTLTITKLVSGKAYNIIPDTAELGGSIRSTSERLRCALKEEMINTCNTIANQYGGSADIKFTHHSPPTINTKKVAETVYNAACKSLGSSYVTWMSQPIPPSEDFSYFLNQTPGCYFLIGNGSPARKLHTSNYDFNDNVIINGSKVMLQSVLDLLME